MAEPRLPLDPRPRGRDVDRSSLVLQLRQYPARQDLRSGLAQEGGPRSYGSGGIGLLIVLIGFAVYDVLWKNMKNETTGMIVSLVLFAVVVFIFHLLMGGRAVFIYAGGLFGTIMAANVWMRIWPSQRKIIAGVKGTGPAADPSIPALAAMRSKHNTYMSFPLIFFMVSNHFPTVYGADSAWLMAIVFVIIGWGITKFLFNKSATPTPAKF
ncbi:MAG: urate hydroxylase PuuD [Deltaproteobacteria bacterium]|nr:MAG: urate hydroxylase PuuD [Deltaproteobacteria bacterium]